MKTKVGPVHEPTIGRRYLCAVSGCGQCQWEIEAFREKRLREAERPVEDLWIDDIPGLDMWREKSEA